MERWIRRVEEIKQISRNRNRKDRNTNDNFIINYLNIPSLL